MHVHTIVDQLIYLRGIGGKADAALIVDDADAHHARLVGHFGDDVVEPVALVAQHVIGGISLDDAAHARGVSQGGALQMLPVQLNIQVAEHTKDDGHRGNQQQKKLGAEAAGDPRPKARGPRSCFRVGHGTAPELRPRTTDTGEGSWACV